MDAEAGDEPPTGFGARLRAARERRGWSQVRLAAEAGLAQPHLSAIERGAQGIPRRSTLQALATPLGVTVAELLGEPDPGEPSSDEEAEILAVYRALSPIGRDSLHATGRALLAMQQAQE